MTEEAASLARIDALVEKVTEAAEKDRATGRGRVVPSIGFYHEVPMGFVRMYGYDANHYYEDPYFYVEQTLRQDLWRWETFPEDDTIITTNMKVELAAVFLDYTFLGLEATFDARGKPYIQADHPLTRDPDLSLLEPVDFKTSGWMPRVLRWYDDIVRICEGRLTVVNNLNWLRFLDAAVQLRGYENLVVDVYERPTFVHDLLRFLVEQRCRWYDAYYRHFGLKPEPTRIDDDWIYVPYISPSMFRDFVLPRYLELEEYHGGIDHIHSCGNTEPVQRYMLEVKSLKSFESNHFTDLEKTLDNVPPDKWLGIAIRPSHAYLGSPEMLDKLHQIADLCSGRRFSVGTSGMPVSEDVNEYVGMIRRFLAQAHSVLGPLRRPPRAGEECRLRVNAGSAWNNGNGKG
jgi:hypothetical protein